MTTWDGATLSTGDALPTALVFNTGTQSFSGAIASEGVYTVMMTKSIVDGAYTYTAGTAFNIHVYNKAPNATGTVEDMRFATGLYIYKQFNVSALFSFTDSEPLYLRLYQ